MKIAGLAALIFLMALCLPVGAERGWAQAPVGRSGKPLVAPKEIVLYLHPDLKSTAFVEILICALERVLTAPVRATPLELPLTTDLFATSTQLDAQRLGARFFAATARDRGPDTFSYLLLPYDLKAPPWRFVFSQYFGDEQSPVHGGVLSTARLDVRDPRAPHKEGADITAVRVYKLILKSVARVAGYWGPEGCILAFPRSLDELDQKSSEFCPEDRAVLVAAGILKAKEDGGCIPVANATPIELNLPSMGKLALSAPEPQ
jgi:predicted Zn-dependent protease